MSAVLRPVGPQPPRVYWVRRLIVLAVLVGLVTLLAVGARALLGGDEAVGAEPTADAVAQEASGDDAPAEDAPAEDPPADDAEEGTGEDAETGLLGGAPVACDPGDLTVTLTADAAAYPAGAEPRFAVAVTNAGDSACTVDAGSGSQVVTITSGPDRIWSSGDCVAEAGERLLLLDPGAQDAVELPWPRVRSDEACTEGLPEPRPGTYQAVATMLGAESAPVVFDLG